MTQNSLETKEKLEKAHADIDEALEKLGHSVKAREERFEARQEQESSPSLLLGLAYLVLNIVLFTLAITFVWNFTIADIFTNVGEIDFLQSGALYVLFQALLLTMAPKRS